MKYTIHTYIFFFQKKVNKEKRKKKEIKKNKNRKIIFR